MAALTVDDRVRAYVKTSQYLAHMQLKALLSCESFVRTDTSASIRKKRALGLDSLDLSQELTSQTSEDVWMVAPELGGAEDVASELAGEFAARGRRVHLVTKLDEGVFLSRRIPELTVHFVKPLEPYAVGIPEHGPVMCFSLSVAAVLALEGCKSICVLTSDEDLQDSDNAVFIPDFIVGRQGAGPRKTLPLSADTLERLMAVNTPELPPHPGVPTVSACIIAKDEEGMIEGCLESLVAFADQTIVNDTGSTDKTAEIAAAFGAEVLKSEWKNDFSEARNLSLARAKGSHVLVIDADERLLSDTARQGRMDLLSGHDAWRIQIRDNLDTHVRTSLAVRLFRNKPVHRYSGRIHEQIAPSIEGAITSSSLALSHLGYNSTISAVRSKRQRNIAILEEEAMSGTVGNAAHHKYQTALELLLTGNLQDGTEGLVQVLDETVPESAFRPSAGLHACEGFLAQGRVGDAYATATRLLNEYPGFLEVGELVAGALLDRGLTAEAGLLIAAATKKAARKDLPKSEGADSYRLHYTLSRLSLGNGQKDAALSYVMSALKAKPDFAPAQILVVTQWPNRAVEILSKWAFRSVRPAVRFCLATKKEALAADIASSAEDTGAEGEISLSQGNYQEAAERFASTGDTWDSMRAAAIAACGLADQVKVDCNCNTLIQKVVGGDPCDISELDSVLRLLGFLLEIDGIERFESCLGTLRPYGDEGRFLAAQVLAKHGHLQNAYLHLSEVTDAPAHLALKADLAYKLGRKDDAACYYAALDSSRPLTPDEYIRYIESLVKCGLIELASEVAVKSLSRYSSNYGLKRMASILGIAK